MARSTNRSVSDEDSRVSAPTDRVEARDLSDPRELSLEEVLKSYEQPINEEQAWAVCYQCCRALRVPRPVTVTGGVYREEFSHPVESLALTVDEVINVRRVLVKAEMEKYQPNKELYNNLKRGKVCCCCRVKFPLFSWPSNCLLCRRCVCGSCSAKMKIPSKKMAHIPVYTLGFHSSPKNHGRRSEVYKSLRSLSRRSVEEEFPHLYAHGCSLRDVCADCTKFVADVISSSRRSLDILNNTPKRENATPRPRPQPRPPSSSSSSSSPQPLSVKRKTK